LCSFIKDVGNEQERKKKKTLPIVEIMLFGRVKAALTPRAGVGPSKWPFNNFFLV